MTIRDDLDARIAVVFQRRGTPLLTLDEAMEQGLVTSEYASDLGFAVTGGLVAYLSRRGRFVPLFRNCDLQENGDSRGVSQVLFQLRQRFRSDEVVLAELIRHANVQQHVVQHPDFFNLKNHWINESQHFLVASRRYLWMSRECRKCEGRRRSCVFCEGTGRVAADWYEHHFEIGGRTYSYHTPVVPERVTTTERLMDTGRKLSATDLPLPRQSVVIGAIQRLMQAENSDPGFP